MQADRSQKSVPKSQKTYRNRTDTCNKFIENATRERIEDCSNHYRFPSFAECVYAGREGSNHPFRSEARRVMEFADATWSICFSTQEEIMATREDHLKPFEEYLHILPDPVTPDSIS